METAKLGLLVLVVLFLIILAVCRKVIVYPFCPLQKYAGKIYRSKSSQYLILHLIGSLAISLACLAYLEKEETLSTFFNENWFRLPVLLFIWLFWALAIGLLIERYLQSTDTEYKEWKSKYLKK